MINRFIVECDVPAGVSVEEFRYYIEESVQANVGMLDPAEPLFHLNRESVHVLIVEPSAAQRLIDQLIGNKNT